MSYGTSVCVALHASGVNNHTSRPRCVAVSMLLSNFMRLLAAITIFLSSSLSHTHTLPLSQALTLAISFSKQGSAGVQTTGLYTPTMYTAHCPGIAVSLKITNSAHTECLILTHQHQQGYHQSTVCATQLQSHSKPLSKPQTALSAGFSLERCVHIVLLFQSSRGRALSCAVISLSSDSETIAVALSNSV